MKSHKCKFKKEVCKLIKNIFKKGQNWSLDLILGIVIFMIILSVFYLVLNQNKGADVKVMKEKSGQVLNLLNSEKSDYDYTILNGNTIDMEKLETLYIEGNYEEAKAILGLKGDFCIVVEDTNGRVIVIQNNTNISGFGSSDLNVSNIPCGNSAN